MILKPYVFMLLVALVLTLGATAWYEHLRTERALDLAQQAVDGWRGCIEKGTAWQPLPEKPPEDDSGTKTK